MRPAIGIFALLLLAANLLTPGPPSTAGRGQVEATSACAAADSACDVRPSREYVVYLGACQDGDLHTVREFSPMGGATPTIVNWCS